MTDVRVVRPIHDDDAHSSPPPAVLLLAFTLTTPGATVKIVALTDRIAKISPAQCSAVSPCVQVAAVLHSAQALILVVLVSPPRDGLDLLRLDRVALLAPVEMLLV